MSEKHNLNQWSKPRLIKLEVSVNGFKRFTAPCLAEIGGGTSQETIRAKIAVGFTECYAVDRVDSPVTKSANTVFTNVSAGDTVTFFNYEYGSVGNAKVGGAGGPS